MLNAPDAIRHVLVANHENYGRNIGAKTGAAALLGSGLFLAEGAAWRHQRRTIARPWRRAACPCCPATSSQPHAIPRRALDSLTGRPIVLMTHLQHLALHIAGQSMFSLEMAGFGTELRARLVDYATRFAQPGALDLILPISLPSPLDLGRRAFRTDWLRFIDRLIDAREAQA